MLVLSGEDGVTEGNRSVLVILWVVGTSGSRSSSLVVESRLVSVVGMEDKWFPSLDDVAVVMKWLVATRKGDVPPSVVVVVVAETTALSPACTTSVDESAPTVVVDEELEAPKEDDGDDSSLGAKDDRDILFCTGPFSLCFPRNPQLTAEEEFSRSQNCVE